jgi:integrase
MKNEIKSAMLTAELLHGRDLLMPRKYQNPKLQIRSDVARPYYFIRVTVPKIDGVTSARTKKRIEERLGYCDDITKARAMHLRAQTLEVVNSHRTIAQSEVLFKNLVRRFLDERVPKLGFAAQQRYPLQIKNHLLPAFGEMRLSEVEDHVEPFLESKVALGWWSRVDLRGILSAIFTAAEKWKLYEGKNPAKGASLGIKKRPVREKRLLTADQLLTVLVSLDEWCRFLVLMLFGIGLNISEALGLQWWDFDLEAGTVSIKRRWYRGDLSEDGDLKTENRVATLALATPLLAELKLRVRQSPVLPNDFVFAAEGSKLPPDDRDLLRERFRPVVKRLGLYYQGFGWHAFRRQNITWRQTVGKAEPMEAQKGGRHGSMDMTLLYTLRDHDRERDQVDLMFKELDDAAIKQKAQAMMDSAPSGPTQ